MPDDPVVSIVEDDDALRTATMRLLRLHGYAVHAFSSAEEFLDSPRVHDTRCLIADMRMPGMSGLALQECLIARGRRIPTIFVTAYPEERCRAKAFKAGAISFLGKPFDGQALMASIDEALARGRT